ncbi:MAG: EF-hand domain-containing protein [Candidatus Competibacterales bacterium]
MMNGLIPRAAGVALLCLTLVPSSAIAQGELDPEQLFARGDLDGNGQVTRQEVIALRHSAAVRLDRNGDGRFDEADAPRFGAFKARYHQVLAQLQRQFDANGDGAVTTAEFINGPTTAFDLADTNGDGRLTRQEVNAAKARHSAKTP